MSVVLSPREVGLYYSARLPGLRQTQAHEWRGRCPLHDGDGDNFAVNATTGGWFCHSQCGKGGDIIELEKQLSRSDFGKAKGAVAAIIGRSLDVREDSSLSKWKRVVDFVYTDEAGTPLFRKVRMERGTGASREKRFSIERFEKGSWKSGLGDTRRVLFRLPELRGAKAVYLVEGEKCALTLAAWGLTATTSPMGAGKWRAEYADALASKNIFVLPDNDDKGRMHALQAIESLLPVAASVRIVELPGLAPKGDVCDWADAGGTCEQLRALARKAPRLEPESLEELRKRWSHPAKEEAAESRGDIQYRRLSDVAAVPIRWLWPDRIARGKVSMIAGDPGLGKSQVTASMSAIVSSGGRWPVDETSCAPGKVVILSAEDDAADTIRPRLEAAGADLNRCFVLDAVLEGHLGNGDKACRSFNLQTDLNRLGETLAKIGDVALIIIDPVTAYLGGVDSHRNAEVRALLAPLSELAARHGAAVVCVSHMNKAIGPKALMRVTGSLAFVAAARAAFAVASDPDDSTRRLFLPLKNNIGNDQTGLAFRIQGAEIISAVGPIVTSKVIWEPEPVAVKADDVFQQTSPEDRGAIADAEDFLRELLASGPVNAADGLERAKAAGVSKSTLNRARDAMGVVARKSSVKGGWIWELPPKNSKIAQGFQATSLGFLGGSEILGHSIDPVQMVEEEL